jgi:hypothetical protein
LHADGEKVQGLVPIRVAASPERLGVPEVSTASTSMSVGVSAMLR